MAYAFEKRIAREPERFGKGAIEGIMAPESANNAADQTGFIPTLTLGIPGTASMALMISVLMIHGIPPGPALVLERPELFWGLIMSFWIGNIILVFLNIPFIGPLHQDPDDPRQDPLSVGADLHLHRRLQRQLQRHRHLGAAGLRGRRLFHALLRLSPAPLILGFVLAPLMEIHLRRSLLLSGGDLTLFVSRPISGTILAFTLLVLALAVWASLRQKRPLALPATDPS